eukprot:6727274-Ditylum_brightwellii.AAC.1
MTPKMIMSTVLHATGEHGQNSQNPLFVGIKNHPLIMGSREGPNFPRFGKDLYGSLRPLAEEEFLEF